MTVEHRVLFDLSDIRALVFECTRDTCQAHARLSVSPDVTDTVKLLQCPSCGARWLADDPDYGDVTGGAFGRLVLALASARKARSSTFRMRLEFAEPKA